MRGLVSRSLPVMVFGFSVLAGSATTTHGARADRRLVLTMPGLTWALEIDESNFSIENKSIDPDKGTAKLLAKDPWTQTTITAFIEKAKKQGGAPACREYHWWQIRKTPFSLKDVHLYESGPMAVLEYSLPKVGTTSIDLKNVNAYMAKDDCWIGVEIAQSSHIPGYVDALRAILDKIRIDAEYVPTVMEDLGSGSYYFLKKDYLKAAAYYQKVLQRKDPEAALNRNSWRVVVDQLGMSYGLSGELDKAQELFEWAIPNDPEYPMFYYNLACTFAEKNLLDRALENLRLAFQYKQHMLKDESFPDPLTDASFKKHRKVKTFWSELKKLK